MSERFELLGMLGRGGTATVHLADDHLRGHQVALKVVHPHLADDPAVQRRLRREVRAASLIQHEAALVPYDLHEVDGALALSMPWHPGETLADRVARQGALEPAEVKLLARRLAGALAASHRAGVLHRDVTAANVLLEQASDAVLTDFGLARVTKAGTQATTGLLGTAGYAAPEVYSGSRADPRSDLYGLGAVLYLAATGVPAFDPGQPMAALKAQLDGSFVPVREHAPQVPAELAALIESLLQPEPSDRPTGPSEVVEVLEGRSEPVSRQAAPRTMGALRLPEGEWTLLVVEKDGDRMRRDMLRAETGRRDSLEAQLAEVGRSIASGLRGLVGWPEPDGPAPEQLLADAVAVAGGLGEGALQPNRAMLDKRFRLVDLTDEATVRQLATRARDLGFKTEVHQVRVLSSWQRSMRMWWWVAIFPMLLTVQALPKQFMVMGWFAFVMGLMALGSVAARADVQRRLAKRAVAFRRDREVVPEAAASPDEEAGPSQTEGERLLDRVVDALDALDEALATDADLPDAARADLAQTAKRLRSSAVALAGQHDRLASALSDRGVQGDQVANLAARLARLDTLEKAGRAVDGHERSRLAAALAEHTASEAAAEEVESELIATKAKLIEVAATARRVRRELARGGAHHSADELVSRLSREAEMLDRARREAAARRQRQ